MNSLDPDRARGVLHELLSQAGRLARDRRHSTSMQLKSDGSPVSDVDQELDAWLGAELPRAFPGCGVIGEEGACLQGTEGTFHIDPIDGTQSYLDGFPYWGPTVCLVRDGKLVLGAFYVPMLDEYWFAATGYGAYRDGERLHLSPPQWGPKRQVLLVSSRFHAHPASARWQGKIRALGSAAAHLALCAAGSGVAAIVPKWALWDVGCGALLITESGGGISSLDGSAFDVVNGEQGLPIMAGAPSALQNLATAFAGRTDGEG